MLNLALQNLRQGLQTVHKKLSRKWLHWRMRGQPEAEILKAERKLRGVEQFDKLQRADIVVVSFGKSGRTWLRVMVSHLFRVMYRLPENAIMGFDNFHNLNRAVPKIFFTHDNYIKDFTGDFSSKQPFYDKRVVLLARDPRDVAVSQFFQWKFRIKPSKVTINNYPPQGSDISLFDFVMGDNGGSMKAVTDYLNLWAAEADKVKAFHLLRYEDLRSNTREELRRLLDFMQVDATDAAGRGGGRVLFLRKHEEDGEQAAVPPRRRPHDAARQGQSRQLQGPPRQGRRLPRLLHRRGSRRHRCAAGRRAGSAVSV